MIILEHSTYDETTVEQNVGMPEYSYWFVRKAFRPLLKKFGTVTPISEPEQDADQLYRSAREQGQSCVFLSFNPPNQMPLGLECPTVPVFAWEFDTIPNESWDDEPRNDWTFMLGRADAAVTHCGASLQAVQRSLGDTFPIWSIPAPIADRNRAFVASARGWREPFELELHGASVLDSRTLDLFLFSGSPNQRSDRALNLLRRATNSPGPEPRRLQLHGVIYTSVFNPMDGRKNWGDMIAGFICAFRWQPDATLILKLTYWNLAKCLRDILPYMAALGTFHCRIVIIHGLLDDAGYSAMVEATSYAVNTSHGEGQCLPLMEFMSAGRPAIAPAHTAMADYVSPENSFVVTDHQRPAIWPHDMRQAIRCLRHQIDFTSLVARYRESFIVARQDPNRYAQMSRAAVVALTRFCSDEVVAERLAQVFRHIGLISDRGATDTRAKDFEHAN
jgi:glycosyltransferase involved in cell wall biosynthesis